MKLYSYYRSSAAYRVRIALNYKNLAYDIIPVNLLQKAHLKADYKQINNQGRVPTLLDDNIKIAQSAAILEYLEEIYPEPSLLPKDIPARAWVRYLAQIIISDIHPLNNASVLNYLKETLGQDQNAVTNWIHHWIKQGFDSLESLLATHPKCQNFCFGDTPTFADCALIPQIYNAYRFNFPVDNYKTLRRIYDHCLTLSYFAKARPENQPDFVHA
ncbi:MAG: maleylacetoacetate isomerase [Legionellales bacterium RIFCSPHIGHO2_12_FULL_37_14]|nr:MAG: maleylacetoacetate isomerase [Legionellales bacterium RIFCSPHIGHO2_12_FULL_37_14]